jgi:S1-C subfamily serine protease
MNSNLLHSWAAAQRELATRAAAGAVGLERPRQRPFSGILWNSDLIVTAAEALRGGHDVTVHTAGERLGGEVLAADLTTDVAIVRTRHAGAPAARSDAALLAAGDPLLVLGREGHAALAAWTHVQYAGPAWQSQRGGTIDRALRLAAPLGGAFEGAGAFDMEARLCAMVVPGPGRRVLAIPVETIERVVTRVLKLGYLPQPYLGVRLQPVALDEALSTQLSRPQGWGVLVAGIEPGSPAAAAGLLLGDLLLTLGATGIRRALDVMTAAAAAGPGAELRCEILRAGERRDLKLTVGERPRG